MIHSVEETLWERSGGILLHPTCLPGPYGIGDLGDAAKWWIDALAAADQKWWQILPLTPAGYGNSPYSSYSAFAGNELLISPQRLLEDGLLDPEDCHPPDLPEDRVDYEAVARYKTRLLEKAWEHFRNGRGDHQHAELTAFEAGHVTWLEDYALFRAIKDSQRGAAWHDWPLPLVHREPEALDRAFEELLPAVSFYKFCQFQFYRQWQKVKEYAHSRGIRVIGDVPIFVADDSADVWANQRLFQLDADGRPKVVAGVPPDYFSATGQLWGNPLYDWEAMRETRFRWWVDRIRTTLEQVDAVRLDHFRGFEAYWEVPARAETAEHGRWVKAPGEEFFRHLESELGRLPLIAEDLGLITEEVHELRKKFNLPGMRVLQFAFGGDSDNPYLPHNYEPLTVVYTGTHDNDTTRGWYEHASEDEKDHLRRYLARDGTNVTWDLIRAAWSSVAKIAIVPLQDVLDLGSEARMNSPGVSEGNWAWRCRRDAVTRDVLDRLEEMTRLYGR